MVHLSTRRQTSRAVCRELPGCSHYHAETDQTGLRKWGEGIDQVQGRDHGDQTCFVLSQ
jgi:hypothetical protein